MCWDMNLVRIKQSVRERHLCRNKKKSHAMIEKYLIGVVPFRIYSKNTNQKGKNQLPFQKSIF
jgi:hypothetical protein